MASLYELTTEMQLIQRAAEMDDGELTPETELALDRIGKELEMKAQGYCQVIRHLESDAMILKAEEDRLKILRQQKENAVRRLKERIHEAMVQLGIDRIDTDLFRLKVCMNARPTIRWVGSMDELPFDYQRTKIEVNLDKAAQDYEDGVQLPSQFEVKLGTHLRIK